MEWACAIVIVAIIVGGWLMAKDIDAKRPLPPPRLPDPPQTDTARAIDVLQQQLEQLHSHYEEDQDRTVLAEISKVNAALAVIATQSTGNICKCGLKKS